MSILAVGSIALDSVKTPFGNVENALGGSASYFSVSASYFSPVNLVAVIGRDFPEEYLKILQKHRINLKGLEITEGKTFKWKGQYTYDLNQAETLDTQLNVFSNFSPKIPEEYRKSEVVFLGNIDPELQDEVLNQVKKPKIVALDTMNFWIERKLAQLKNVLKKVDILLINEAEARQLTGESNLVKAAKIIHSMGPKSLVVKRGEYGSLFFNTNHIFSAPAYPLEQVFDPTGAGDSFAGGFIGYLAKKKKFNDCCLRQAIIFGSIMASFNVQDFSLGKISKLSWNNIIKRFNSFRKLTHFDVVR